MRMLLPSLLAAVAAGLSALPAAAAEEDVFGFAVAQPDVIAQPDVLFLADGQVSEYWLGVTLRPADETLQAQLGIKQGVVVEHVAKESPASKAGLVEHDVLHKFAGQEIAGVHELMKLVEERKDKEADLEVIRHGKRETMKIAAAKRPEGAAERIPLPPNFRAALPAGARQWVERFGGEAGQAGEGPIRFQFAHPGVIMKSVTARLEPMPKDLRITMTKQGEEPLKIVVEQGEKKWEATEKELDKLPKEVRVHVERMLSGHAAMGIFHAAPGNVHALPAVPGVPAVPVVPGAAIPVPAPFNVPVPAPGGPARIMVRAFGGEEMEKRMEKRLEELQKRVEELEKRVK